jgi:hypothetical protein
MDAVCSRVLTPVPHPTPEGLVELRSAAEYIATLLPHVTPNPFGVMPLLYRGAKRARYLAAELYVQTHAWSEKWASITAFVKFEKVVAKLLAIPRIIQFRDPRYCVDIARFLKPLERYLYDLVGQGASHNAEFYVPPTRLMGKGLNSLERASLLKTKMNKFKRPFVLSIDMKRFDQHCVAELLALEHLVYLICLPNPWFAFLLTQQMTNRCRTRLGLKYVTFGKRMSGDMNTALGNCLIMLIMICAAMRRRFGDYEVMIDGDDTLIIVEEEFAENMIRELPAIFLNYGHEVKLENRTSCFNEVVWCQSSPIYTVYGDKFVRNPFKCMANDLTGPKWNTQPAGRLRLLATIGVCEAILHRGVPVLEEYAKAICRASRGVKTFVKHDYLFTPLALRTRREFRSLESRTLFMTKAETAFAHLSRLKFQPISTRSREEFAVAFHVSIERQIQMENYFKAWSPNVYGQIDQLVTFGLEGADYVDLRCIKPERLPLSRLEDKFRTRSLTPSQHSRA